MSKVQSGLILMAIGIGMNVLGRLVIVATQSGSSTGLAGLMAIWMIASVVIGLFGLFRLIVGLVSNRRPPNAG